MTIQDVPPEHEVFQSQWGEALIGMNALECRHSFKTFRQTIRPKMKWNWMVDNITQEMQGFYNAFVAGKRPKLAIELPPQHGKSWSAEDFAAWIAGKQPAWKTIYASYSDTLGTLRNRNLYRLFKSARYQQIFPDFVIDQPGWQCNTGLIEYVGDVGSFRNTTIEGTINGMELHLGVVDDYAKGRSEANSKNARDKTWNWFTDDFMARFAQESAMLILCTRWHVDDVIGRYKKKFPNLREIKFSAIAEADDQYRRKGEALFPALKTKSFLMERKALMTQASWESEYQQHPFLVSSGMFPIEKLQVLSTFDRRDISASILSVDKAGTQGGDGAYTAIVLMHKMKNGTFVIERVVRGHWGALEREEKIKAYATGDANALARLGVSYKIVIEVEPGSGGKESGEATVRNLAGFIVILDKPGANRSKVVRAEPFAAQVQGGNVYLHAGTWIPDFLEEAQSWPNSPQLDQLDASAQAFHHLTSAPGYTTDLLQRAFA